MALAIDGTPQTTIHSTNVTSSQVTLSTTNAYCRAFVYVLVNGTTINNITDTASLTWTKYIQGQYGAGPGNSTEIWYTDIGAAALSSDVITINFVGTATYSVVDGFCVSNGGNSNGLDFDAGGPQEVNATPPSITTVNAACLVIGTFRCTSTDAPTTGAGYTAIVSGVANTFCMCNYQLESATGTYTPTINTGSADQNTGIAFGVIAHAAVIVVNTMTMPMKLIMLKMDDQ